MFHFNNNIKNSFSTFTEFVRVLVLEAGGEDPLNPFISTPLLVSTLQRSSIDWHYVTESQQYSSGALKNNVSYKIQIHI